MPNRKNRARRRQGGAGALLPTLIVLLALVAVALVMVLIYSDPLAAREDQTAYAYSGTLPFEQKAETGVPLVLGSLPTPVPTAEPAASPAPTQASAPTATPAADGEQPEVTAPPAAENRLIPTPMPGDYFLPVFNRALRTADDEAMIAITIDRCDDVDAMTRILKIADQYKAQITLFPSGDALMKLASGFRTCVNSLRYEIEGCTYDAKKRDYTLSTGEMALQIWRQGIATSYAMTKDYQMHFYRSSLPQSANDQRTHFFLRKLGYLGVAGYTYSYKGNDIDALVDSLENGNIYQFDMSKESMELLEPFLREANRRGYKLVTMNDLFGLERNAVSGSLTIDQQTLPGMDDYVATYYDLKLNDRTNAVYTLQARLMGLGYLVAQPGKSLIADGIYGGDTSVAVSAFQARVGLVGTGNADVETQEKMFAPDAPFAYQ